METEVNSNKTELRKVRKKLRDIERLSELSRPLNAEEAEKIARKAEYEEQVQKFEALVGTEAGAVELSPSSDQKQQQSSKEPSPRQPKFIKLPHWAGLKFDVSKFSGHEEPVTSLTSCHIETGKTNLARFVSTSSDTTARMWHIGPKTVEEIDASQAQRTVFSGHTLKVTCGLVISDARKWLSQDFLAEITIPNGIPNRADEQLSLLLTTSLDCNVSIWCLESGKLLYSLYTYQPITQMALVDVDLVFTGTESGKLELWNLREKVAIYSAVFDQNAAPIGWISKANDSGHIVACSRGDLLGVFELTSDPLVGAMINQCFSSNDLKTARGESYVLRKVTALVAHDSRIYVTTRHRPTIKAIGWGSDTSSTQQQPIGQLTVNRFAGRHFENGSFVALQIWSPSPDGEEPSFLFAVEVANASQKFAIHVHSLPHKNYALSNFYAGSLVVAFDEEIKSGLASMNMTIGSMALRKCHEEGVDEKEISPKVSPCLFLSISDLFLALSPSIYPVTVSENKTIITPEKVSFCQLELYPKPSIVNFSVNLHSDQFGDDTFSEEKSDHLTTEEDGAIVVPSARVVPGIKKARLDLAVGPNEDDDNPPTDVEDEDDDYATHVDNVQGGRGRGWTNSIKNMCSIL